jgi:hypothetical protein
MNLDEAQKKTVTSWIAEGLKLSDIQKRLASELGLNCTYMEVRFLVDDLKLMPKDVEPPKTAQLAPSSAATAPAPSRNAPGAAADLNALPGEVSVSVDQIARPGAVVSGKVTFSDGMSAEWSLDQSGRIGLLPKQAGYRPSQEDVADFQAELQNQLAKLGF